MRADAPLILASASPRRAELLARIGVTPDRISPADIDETPARAELPRPYAQRLAREKARAVAEEGAFTLAGDTVVAVGRRILEKPEDEAQARRFLTLMSGRRHTVITAICLIAPDGAASERCVETQVKFKRLTEAEIAAYLKSGEWRGKAGGYGVQGMAEMFVTHINGSHSAVVGLPLYETASLLSGRGYPILAGDDGDA
ncbi:MULTISPECIES: Maf family protein [Euryhalocaulis]|uniref:Maf family protein n=1 Tax=Euryhalocaulis TaxID=1712422 RepID=UPI0003A0DB77|nr:MULTISPECIES: nucleoside triphosphate pyrophosphatase [Euryhalocaulis]MBA4801480.1 septum formation inhibitor Maf [Euryhalocaulis sp.]